MSTIKLYQKDPYLRVNTAKIVDIISSQDDFILVLDKTIFFPTGGGQSCDKGKINNFEVISVYEENNIVYHNVQCNNSNIVLKIGDTVECTIDWNHRFLNMQRHCGEHILSGIFYGEYGGVNRGFHMGDEYMTIDINLEENPDFQTLTWEMAIRAERLANEVIWSNAPVVIRHFDSFEEASKLPLRKALSIDHDISIVCVGDITKPSDCVACCGTHPSTAGQVGLIKILKVENYKGMFRVYCEAGKKAMEIFDDYHELLLKLNKKYSASTTDLIDKINIQEDKFKAIKNEHHRLKQSVINERTCHIMNSLDSNNDSSLESKEALDSMPKLNVYTYDDMKIDDLLQIGRALIPKVKNILALVSNVDKTILLFSSGQIDCGKLVKDNAHIYQGKGGGNSTSARAMFPKEEYLDTFIDLLEKHLR